MSYSVKGLGSAGSAKRYWNNYAKSCSQFGDEGACLTRAIQHGADVTFSASGLGQTPAQTAASAMTTAANFTEIGVHILRNPEVFASTQAPRIVDALDRHIVSPLVDRATVRATPYIVRYLLPPLSVLYILSGLAAFYSYEVLKENTPPKKVLANRRRRRRS